jgi:NTP pyrophosphatase (non-canonical NTP hydrolase)
MPDAATTVADLRDVVRQFVAERAWEVFHSPKNLAMSVAIEAAELMERFQWLEVAESRQVIADPQARAAIAEEIADVASYLLALCNVMHLDLSDTVQAKMAKNAAKYPVGAYRGRYGPEDQRAPLGTGGGEQGQPASGEGPAGLEAEGSPC